MPPVHATRSLDSQTAQAFNDILIGYRRSRALYIVAKFGIPDLLKEGPKSVTDLAQATGTHEPSLLRFLRAVNVLGFFEEVAPAVFAQSKYSDYFCTDHPSNMYYMALFLGSDCQMAPMLELEYTIQTGLPAFEHIYEMNYQAYLKLHPEYLDLFRRCTAAYSFIDDAVILQALDFSTIHTLVDAGGGVGSFIMAALKKFPLMRGTLFEQQSTIARAKTLIAQTDYADRCTLQVGNLLTDVPVKADAYFLKHVLHIWDDEHCLKVLNNFRKAMLPHSKLLICEVVVGNKGSDDLYDLVTLVRRPPEIRERTIDEFCALLSEADLHINQIIFTTGRHFIVEATLPKTSSGYL